MTPSPIPKKNSHLQFPFRGFQNHPKRSRFTYGNMLVWRRVLLQAPVHKSDSWDCSRSPATTEGSSEQHTENKSNWRDDLNGQRRQRNINHQPTKFQFSFVIYKWMLLQYELFSYLQPQWYLKQNLLTKH